MKYIKKDTTVSADTPILTLVRNICPITGAIVKYKDVYNNKKYSN